MRLKFHTSRPESFAVYKRTREDGPWIPYQYYSGSCENTYSKANRGFIRTGGDEQQALCTDEFSDISPLTGGNVAFSTLEGRPSAYNFDNSPVLQVGTPRVVWGRRPPLLRMQIIHVTRHTGGWILCALLCVISTCKSHFLPTA